MAAPRAAASLPAFVLHQHDWSESSLILDLFTRGQGRVVAAAKGAKRPYSQLRPVLLPFQRLNVLLGKLRWNGSDSWCCSALLSPFHSSSSAWRVIWS